MGDNGDLCSASYAMSTRTQTVALDVIGLLDYLTARLVVSYGRRLNFTKLHAEGAQAVACRAGIRRESVEAR